ncbi:unnamed protein product [Amoebophrya sp. A120]|nr:unnamed protein product [Amoebophrya sp. A120]|eukprot:GSA120T00002153001.1
MTRRRLSFYHGAGFLLASLGAASSSSAPSLSVQSSSSSSSTAQKEDDAKKNSQDEPLTQGPPETTHLRRTAASTADIDQEGTAYSPPHKKKFFADSTLSAQHATNAALGAVVSEWDLRGQTPHITRPQQFYPGPLQHWIDQHEQEQIASAGVDLASGQQPDRLLSASGRDITEKNAIAALDVLHGGGAAKGTKPALINQKSKAEEISAFFPTQASSPYGHTRMLQSGTSASAQAARVWGIFNAVDQPDGWRLSEVAFFEDDGCNMQLTPIDLRSGPTINTMASSSSVVSVGTAGEGSGSGSSVQVDSTSCLTPQMSTGNRAKKALDGFENTMWVANCCPCPRGKAFIGADFGSPVIVKCVLITQVPGYHATSITLMKETGQLQVGTNSLWVPVITWDDMYPMLNRVYSGIKLDDLAVTFVKQPFAQCYGGMYGPQYVGARALQEAENACKGDKNCQGVYQQACEPLIYSVSLMNRLDLQAVHHALYPPSATTMLPVMTTAPPPPPQIPTNILLPGGGFVLEGSTTQYNQWNLTASSNYPINLTFQTFPKYGIVRMCSRAILDAVQHSTEGSCIWKKTGAMINYLPYSNFEAIRNFPGLTILSLTYVMTAADCAELCLQTATCNAFQFLIRREARVPTLNCELFSYPNDFKPPVGLRKTDGVVDIIDFYQYDTWNSTLSAVAEGGMVATSAATSTTTGGMSLLLGVAALFVASTILW